MLAVLPFLAVLVWRAISPPMLELVGQTTEFDLKSTGRRSTCLIQCKLNNSVARDIPKIRSVMTRLCAVQEDGVRKVELAPAKSPEKKEARLR